MRGASEDKEKGEEKRSEGREIPPLAESEYYNHLREMRVSF